MSDVDLWTSHTLVCVSVGRSGTGMVLVFHGGYRQPLPCRREPSACDVYDHLDERDAVDGLICAGCALAMHRVYAVAP